MATDLETAKAKVLQQLATDGSDVAAYQADGVNVQRFNPRDIVDALLKASSLVQPTSSQSATTYAEVVT